MITAKVIGATGYGGVGIIELLHHHPEVELVSLIAQADTGVLISELYPHLTGFCDLKVHTMEDEESAIPSDVVFFATPDGVAMKHAKTYLDQGSKVIDYSGDFRFKQLANYKEYAQRLGRDSVHMAPDLLDESQYGLPELHRVDLHADCSLIGNVGCFAVGCILGLVPAVQNKIIDLSHIICDCKTGISGAGKKPSQTFHYPDRHDHMNAYRLSGHQHVCEIEGELSQIAGEAVTLTFTAQAVPSNRGILSCLYAPLLAKVSYQEVKEVYDEFHTVNEFVRIFDRNAAIGTTHVRNTNYCNLVVDLDERTQTLRIISHIDNLMKGQAGNALQNMNLLFGLPESMGLDRSGSYP